MTDKELRADLEKRFGGPYGWSFVMDPERDTSEILRKGFLAVAMYRDHNKQITDVISFSRPTELEALQALEKALDLLSLRTMLFSKRLGFETRFEIWCIIGGLKSCALNVLNFINIEGIRGELSTGSSRETIIGKVQQETGEADNGNDIRGNQKRPT